MIERLLFVAVRRGARLPSRSHKGDAGLDLYAAELRRIPSGEADLVPTGVATAIPYGWAGLIWPRGSQGRIGVDVLAGVVDASYRGEIEVALYAGETPVEVSPGERIGQLLVQPVELPEPEWATELPAWELSSPGRGAAGWGSTGR